ncbi:MAG: hypothetical protein J7647_05470 [Cyanobacteria bacterium SBLK]|nr:hypothetical protein [Cyanobacteria bacterium SBLK]
MNNKSEKNGVVAQGTGLKVKHYRDLNFGHISHQQDGQLNCDWGDGSTVWMGTPPDGHSSTWTSRIEAPTSEKAIAIHIKSA